MWYISNFFISSDVRVTTNSEIRRVFITGEKFRVPPPQEYADNAHLIILPKSADRRDDFPLPTVPTTATKLPWSTMRFKSWRSASVEFNKDSDLEQKW